MPPGPADLCARRSPDCRANSQLARPIADAGASLEVVCHLADMDAVYAERMKRVIAEGRADVF